MSNIHEKINQLHEIVTPFDDFEDEALLDEIQGNIIKAHGRNHSVHLFLQFTGDPDLVKQGISKFTHKYITSALAQAEDGKRYRQNQTVPSKIFGNLFFTAAGYQYLGYDPTEISNDPSFLKGMKHPDINDQLGDDVQQWEAGFQQEIHALVLLAGDKRVGPRTEEAKQLERKDQTKLCKQPFLLAQQVETIKQDLDIIAKVVHEDIGYVLRSSETGEEIEHFGFRDGVSQPLFLKRDIDREREESDFSQWDPRAPLSLVLSKDPLGEKEESYGSFLVYRKLEQNVKGWKKDVEALAEKLKGSEKAEPTLAGAYTMGRFQDGTPVVLENQPNSQISHENNFNYSQDPQGQKCPFQSHTRKVNPRGESKNLDEEKMNRIVRRGINYGPLPSEEPETDAGLLFLCFQANLETQFNLMQQHWCNQRDFLRPGLGTDAVIGVETKTVDANGNLVAVTESYKWPKKWGEAGQTQADFSHWVTMKGGEYFFAPSMSFLKSFLPEPCRDIVFRGVPKQEIQAAKDKINELRDYQARNWAIGINGDTLQPDEFLNFFNQRHLEFEFYLRNQVGLGDNGAYDRNIKTLTQYIKDVRNKEIEECEYKIAELKEYQELNWAIGFDGETLNPDQFVRFFGERHLPFQFYVKNKTVSLGDQSAYNQNIDTLNDYIRSLKD